MFLSKYALDKAVDTLQEDDFYYNNNRIIFNTLVNLSNKNIPIDMTSVVTEIKNNDKLIMNHHKLVSLLLSFRIPPI